MSLTDDTGTDPASPGGARRWPLGTLTLIVAAAASIGILLFGGGGEDEATDTTLHGALGLPTQNGETAPDFSITLLDGSEFHLAEHLATDGRPVILNLWASWCGPCRAEMPALDAASMTHTDVLFLGIAVDDDPIAAEEFADEIKVSYPLAIDEADRVGRRYPSPGLPATYFITSDGQIVRTIFGQIDEGQIRKLIASSF